MNLKIKRVICATVAGAVLLLPLSGAESGTAAAPAQKPEYETSGPEANFPFAIRVSTWAASGGFRKGDRIKIESVRGDRKRIEPGGTYLVQGTYTLASAPTARLALSLTLPAGGGRRAWSGPQFYDIEKGTGTFAFTAKMEDWGKYHVSFYISDGSGRGGSAAGGIYFE
jgi:hypothetical protein